MILRDIATGIEAAAPLSLQEDYDNSGLQVGNPEMEVTGILICVDVTEEVVNEASSRGCNLIISHHPLIFGGLKRITPGNSTGRIIQRAIQDQIAIYAVHTNLDNIGGGVSHILATKLRLRNLKVLRARNNMLRKLVTFCPLSHSAAVRDALFGAGSGHIGNYDSCSFNSEGYGTFRALEGTNPFIGKQGELHTEKEVRIETVYPAWMEGPLLRALMEAHPYEEVAYDIYLLGNDANNAGSGMTGELEHPMTTVDFLSHIKQVLNTPHIRHSSFQGEKVKRVAVCGGSGAFLIGDALASGVDAYITGDIKYHDFFRPEGKLLLVDAGHYETEQFSKDLLQGILMKKFPNFAVLISEQSTNSVNYL